RRCESISRSPVWYGLPRPEDEPMRRRKFMTLLGGAAAVWPFSARAQRVHRIGFVLGLAENDPESHARIAALRDGLGALGWTEGRNISIDARFAGGDFDRVRAHVADLVVSSPALVV